MNPTVVKRTQTGVRIEASLLKVLKALAEYTDLTLGDLLEGIVLHAFEGKAPFSAETRKVIEQLRKPLRDIRHLVAVLLRVLLFATPIFYSLSIVPEPFQSIIALNPLAIFVNHFRRVILWGEMPDWTQLLIVSVISFVICWLGYLWFMKTRRLFADVI